MRHGHVSLEEAREAVRREVLAHLERVVGRRVPREGAGEKSRSLDSAAKRGCARDDERSEGVGEKSRSLDSAAKRGCARDDGSSEGVGETSRSLDSAAKRGCARDDSSHEGESERVKSIVIDVPFEAVKTSEQVRVATGERVRVATSEQVRTIRRGEAVGDVSLERCQRVMADGRVCGLPAYDGTDQCVRHYRWYSLVPNYYGLPYPENATAVQEILARVAALVLRKQVEPRIGDTVARLCREMSRNLGAYQRELEAVRRETAAMEGPWGVQ